MTKPEPAVLIRDLSFRYPKTVSGRSVTALRSVTLSLYPGELTAITGPSGSGKSSLFRCFNGLIPHATKGVMEGDVIIHGMNTRDHDVAEFAPRVGLVFQDPAYQLVTGDVTSEIAFGPENLNLPGDVISGRIGECAGILGIRHLLGRQIRKLSWGERQRVAIASVLAMHPQLLVMDEPFSGIDASSATALSTAIRTIRQELGTTVVIFEHRLPLLAGIAERLVVLENGAVSYDGAFPSGGPAGHAACRSGSFSGATPQKNPAAGHRTHAGISFRNVVFRYPGSGTDALSGITMDLYPKEIAVISGPNGSGKTTLLKMCNGLLRADAGEVLINGIPVGNRPVAALSRVAGLLCQHADFQLFEASISDELAFAPRNIGMGEEEIARRMASVLAECSLGGIDPSSPPLGLSGGEKQRVAIAGLFVMNTPVVVLDEPTFGLDTTLKRALAAALMRMRDENRTIVVATHDEEFASLCADRSVSIRAGRIAGDIRMHAGTMASVKELEHTGAA
jgi:energy-coupling factor transport system ATP-binding protein